MMQAVGSSQTVTANVTHIETRALGFIKKPAIEVRGLRDSYSANEAVQGIDLNVYDQENHAFVGPNGARKTTTVEILEGYRDRDGSEAAESVLEGELPVVLQVGPIQGSSV